MLIFPPRRPALSCMLMRPNFIGRLYVDFGRARMPHHVAQGFLADTQERHGNSGRQLSRLLLEGWGRMLDPEGHEILPEG
jgi:hypothetical protein